MFKRIGDNKLLRNRRRRQTKAKPENGGNASLSTSQKSNDPTTNRNFGGGSTNSTISDVSTPSHRRKLQFKPSIQIREYVDDTDDSQKRLMWYTDEEYDQMEVENTKVVKAMLQQEENLKKTAAAAKLRRPTVRQLGGHTQRGLEKMTPDAWDRTQDIREIAFEAVFREQERQQKQQIWDPVALSTVYQRACSTSQQEASNSGLRDERFICKEYGPMEPSGIKLATGGDKNKDEDGTIPKSETRIKKDPKPSNAIRGRSGNQWQRGWSKPDPD